MNAQVHLFHSSMRVFFNMHARDHVNMHTNMRAPIQTYASINVQTACVQENMALAVWRDRVLGLFIQTLTAAKSDVFVRAVGDALVAQRGAVYVLMCLPQKYTWIRVCLCMYM